MLGDVMDRLGPASSRRDRKKSSVAAAKNIMKMNEKESSMGVAKSRGVNAEEVKEVGKVRDAKDTINRILEPRGFIKVTHVIEKQKGKRLTNRCTVKDLLQALPLLEKPVLTPVPVKSDYYDQWARAPRVDSVSRSSAASPATLTGKSWTILRDIYSPYPDPTTAPPPLSSFPAKTTAYSATSNGSTPFQTIDIILQHYNTLFPSPRNESVESAARLSARSLIYRGLTPTYSDSSRSGTEQQKSNRSPQENRDISITLTDTSISNEAIDLGSKKFNVSSYFDPLTLNNRLHYLRDQQYLISRSESSFDTPMLNFADERVLIGYNSRFGNPPPLDRKSMASLLGKEQISHFLNSDLETTSLPPSVSPPSPSPESRNFLQVPSTTNHLKFDWSPSVDQDGKIYCTTWCTKKQIGKLSGAMNTPSVIYNGTVEKGSKRGDKLTKTVVSDSGNGNPEPKLGSQKTEDEICEQSLEATINSLRCSVSGHGSDQFNTIKHDSDHGDCKNNHSSLLIGSNHSLCDSGSSSSSSGSDVIHSNSRVHQNCVKAYRQSIDLKSRTRGHDKKVEDFKQRKMSLGESHFSLQETNGPRENDAMIPSTEDPEPDPDTAWLIPPNSSKVGRRKTFPKLSPTVLKSEKNTKLKLSPAKKTPSTKGELPSVQCMELKDLQTIFDQAAKARKLTKALRIDCKQDRVPLWFRRTQP